MLARTNQTTALTAYVTARLSHEADAVRQGIAATGAPEAEASRWAWVRQARQRHAATHDLLRVLNERCGDGGETALLSLAAFWSQHPPLADQRGLPYTATTDGLAYVSDCCQATTTVTGTALRCRSCQREVDPVRATPPEPSTADIQWRAGAPGRPTIAG